MYVMAVETVFQCLTDFVSGVRLANYGQEIGHSHQARFHLGPIAQTIEQLVAGVTQPGCWDMLYTDWNSFGTQNTDWGGKVMRRVLVLATALAACALAAGPAN